MKKCPFCNAEIEGNARFCLYCMRSLEDKEVIKVPQKIISWRIYASSASAFIIAIAIICICLKSDKHTPHSLREDNQNSFSTSSATHSYASSDNNISFQSTDLVGNSLLLGSSSSVLESNNSYFETSNSSASTTSTSEEHSESISTNPSQAEESSVTDITEYLVYQIKNFEVTIVNCEKSITGDVKIPEYIEGYPVRYISSNSFEGCTNITSLHTPDTVYDIGDSVFKNCTALKSVRLSNFSQMGEYVFYGCTSLTDVDFGAKKYILWFSEGTFYGCTSLKNISLPYIKDIGAQAFYGCTSLETVYIPSELNGVNASAFHNCVNLKDFYSYSEKSEVSIRENNEPLENATWHLIVK